MSNKIPKRCFGFGCRETPDYYNKFLERMGYYRKHVATDSSSLFRVVSELHYDIQLYHEKVRAECVKFMSKNKALFIKDIRYGYESYVNNIARSRTYGSLLELRALALLYKANVFLFEPCTEGKWYMYNAKYTVTWRVFIGRDNHFDVVYPLEYIKAAATSQAIVYQILYSKVLNLPDVEYAVERMLHDPEGKLLKYEKNKAGTTFAITEDGLQLELSKPGRGTQCVLMYSHLCHFHNQTNFLAIERFFMEHGPEEGCRMYLNDTFRVGPFKPNPLLRESKISCVRQLLAIGITPFPYKAAKSLDPNIYRNVEYDVWQEVRAERLVEMLGNEKKIHEFKPGKRAFKHVNPLKLIKKEVKFEMPTDVSEPEATEPKCLEIDPSLTIAPYPLQSIYFPTPDQYGLNTIGVIPSDANHLTFADSIGVPGCLCSHFPPSSPLVRLRDAKLAFRFPFLTILLCYTTF
uniref:OTU domain-containing protein n=1 Tax=Anopheles maculatus TaxID=74869 RepID=A0A182TAX0_9DIPT